MFNLKNQIILIVLFCIFSNLISAFAKDNTNNLEEDAKKELNSFNELYGQIDNQRDDLNDNEDLMSNMIMLKKSNLINDNSYNDQLNNVEWEPINWQPSIDETIELIDSDEQMVNKKSAIKKSGNGYLMQPKRQSSNYRPIRAQRCLKRGSLCDAGANPIINCCSHSVCRCNFFSDQCRCDRMSLLQKVWGKK